MTKPMIPLRTIEEAIRDGWMDRVRDAATVSWVLVCDTCAHGREIKTIGVMRPAPVPCAVCGVVLPAMQNGLSGGAFQTVLLGECLGGQVDGTKDAVAADGEVVRVSDHRAVDAGDDRDGGGGQRRFAIDHEVAVC